MQKNDVVFIALLILYMLKLYFFNKLLLSEAGIYQPPHLDLLGFFVFPVVDRMEFMYKFYSFVVLALSIKFTLNILPYALLQIYCSGFKKIRIPQIDYSAIESIK